MGASRRKLGAVNAGGPQPGLDLGRIGGAVQMHFAAQVAAPAGVGAGGQPRELAKLASRHSRSRWIGIWRSSAPRCALAFSSTTPVSARSRLTSVRAGWPRSLMRQSPGFSCQNERSVSTSENGSFSAPFLKLMRELVAAR